MQRLRAKKIVPLYLSETFERYFLAQPTAYTLLLTQPPIIPQQVYPDEPSYN